MAPVKERTFLATAGSSGGRVIPTPFEFFTTGEDNIRVISANSVVGVALKINMRFVDNAGTITPTSWDHTPNTDRSTKTTDQPLGTGAVMNLTVFANAGAPRVGQTFVIVQLIRGTGPAAIVLGTLLQGYVTTKQGLGWPGSPIQSSTEGEPNIRTLGGTLPGLGNDVSETVPIGARWELLALSATLIASAVVGDRIARLALKSNVDFIALLPQPVAVTATLGAFFTWAANVPSSSVGASNVQTMAAASPCPLLAGQVIATSTVGLQAGDTWSAPIFTVREWLEVN